MNNYAEELAYWYLRLNEFFPLPNLMTYRWEKAGPSDALCSWNAVEHSADADLVALRAPFVTEPIGGMPDDWDCAKFNEQWHVPLTSAHVGLIVEVKSGPYGELAADRPDQLQYCVGRLGLFPSAKIPKIAQELTIAPSVFRDGAYVGKLLVGVQAPPERWLYLPLEDAEAFIHKRMHTYVEKDRDRMFFPSPLIQYLAAARAPRRRRSR